MGTATTFRADVRAGGYGLLTGFVAANPTYHIAAYRYRPDQFGDRPLAFVQINGETINHTGTTLFQRTMSGFSVVFVWASGADHKELGAIRDVVIDAFVTYGMAHVHAISNQTVTSPTGVEDVELEMDGAFYPASIVTFGDTLSLEGSL